MPVAAAAATAAAADADADVAAVSVRGFDDESPVRAVDVVPALAVGVATAVPVLRFPTGAVLGRESGVCCENASGTETRCRVDQ